MISPVETIADALFSFILSLLNDPDAREEFENSPETSLANAGLQNVCLADLQAVRPVIVDHPHVTPRPDHDKPDHGHHHDDEVVREITKLVSTFTTTTVDARSTIVDQSVNQNIWTSGGDVTQLFDQEAVIASGDEAVAAGDDASSTDSSIDFTADDIAIGNTKNNDSYNTDASNHANDSFNKDGEIEVDSDVDVDTEVDVDIDNDVDVDIEHEVEVDADIDVNAPAGGSASSAQAAAAEAPRVDEPADLLEGDMTAGDDAYAASDSSSVAALDELPLDDLTSED